ncbi:MAG: DUF4147 domain-containing protein [Planctomycetota bacterium]
MNTKLQNDALAIWNAGVEAVKPAQLFRDQIHVRGSKLLFQNGEAVDLKEFEGITVVGAGKAAAAMTVAFVQQILPALRIQLPHLIVRGWINCPEGSIPDISSLPDLSTETKSSAEQIRLFAARPAGINIPTPQAVVGTKKILELVSHSPPTHLVLCLLSGGGSALLSAPCDGIDLEEKQAIAELIAAAGGNIEQLNAVRRALSRVKAGGLARACGSKKLVTLVLSDVLGDPLETIASGPTFTSIQPDAEAAIQALDALGLFKHPRLENVIRVLTVQAEQGETEKNGPSNVKHVILGNNAIAVEAAAAKAQRLGFEVASESATQCEGDVHILAKHAAIMCRDLKSKQVRSCWISGGEPTVQLPADAGKGGRNQQLCLSVLHELKSEINHDGSGFIFLSGGTDGEDGPTDAAGAWIDSVVLQKALSKELKIEDYLQRANAYEFFQRTGSLLLSGPTGTNVCDLRVAVCS